MIADKGLPALGRRVSSPDHILGHARLSDIDAELEKLSMDPRRSPQWVCNAHLSDQPAYFERHRWSTATRSRLPAPVRSEPGTVPTDNGFRLHNRQRIANVRKQSIQTNEYQSVDSADGEFLWSSPPQNVYLLPQRPNLCLKRRSRADQIDDHPTNKPAKIPHGTTASPDSLSTANQTRFATGTGTKYRGVRDRHFQGRFLTLGRGRIDQRHFAPQYDRHFASTRRARESSLIGTTVGAYWAERMANMCFPSLNVNTT